MLRLISAASLFYLTVTLGFGVEGAIRKGVDVIEKPDRLTLEVDGKLITEYWYTTNAPRPYLYPIIGPDGLNITRDFPMKETSGENRDHPHHRSLWIGHGAVNGHDCWAEGKNSGRIRHLRFTKMESGKDVAIIATRNAWVTADEKVLCHDERTFRFHRPTEKGEWKLDLAITWKATEGQLTLGDTKEGTVAVRLAETMPLTKSPEKTVILNSNNDRNRTAWGKRAAWCDYSGPVHDQILGVAILDHPSNPRHPTWWHVRDYGLFAANPFGKHDFEGLKDTKSAGDLVIAEGESVTFRYRFVFHKGNAEAANIQSEYENFAAEQQKHF